MHSEAASVDAYLASLPPERQAALTAVRAMILKHLPKGDEESMRHGMIEYHVPLAVLPGHLQQAAAPVRRARLIHWTG